MLKIIQKDKAGMSFANVMAIIFIIGVISSISIPYIRRYNPSLALSATARDLLIDLRYAQQQALSTQITYGIYFDEVSDSYQIISIDAATTTIKEVALADGIEFDSVTGLTDNVVKFNSYGAVYESGEIVLDNANGDTKIINIKPSGYVQLSQ